MTLQPCKPANRCQALKKENIGYQYIVLGISDKKYIKINEFTKNDSNVDILELSTKIKIKKIGGYI